MGARWFEFSVGMLLFKFANGRGAVAGLKGHSAKSSAGQNGIDAGARKMKFASIEWPWKSSGSGSLVKPDFSAALQMGGDWRTKIQAK
jgi:hypothetical protein